MLTHVHCLCAADVRVWQFFASIVLVHFVVVAAAVAVFGVACNHRMFARMYLYIYASVSVSMSSALD